MSRYGDYGARGPPAERWTPERFERERGGRQSQVLERDRYEERDAYSSGGYRRRESSADDHFRRSGPARTSFEDDRFYEREERYGPPARAARDRSYYEEDDYEVDRYDSKGPRGARDREYFEEDRRTSTRGGPPPPRPGQLIRRQSSLDTFDRKPARPRYGPQRRRSPEIIPMRGPRKQRPSSPRRHDDFYDDDIQTVDYDRFHDERFHGLKEREIETVRRRRRSSSPKARDREVFAEQVVEEQPYPRRGKTKMSAPLVNKRVVIELGYPFHEDFTEEGDFVILEVALNKPLIDEVLFKSKERNEFERERITYALEAPPPAPRREEIVERREIVIDKSDNEVPRSVREWDVMSGAIEKSHHGDSKSTHGAKTERLSVHDHKSSHSRRKSRGRSASRTTIKIHKSSKSRSRSHSRSSGEKQLVLERKSSHKRHHRHRSHGAPKSEYYEEDVVGESNAMHTGPLAIALSRNKSQTRRGSDKRVREEIIELEREKERLRRERKKEKKYHRRHHSRRPSRRSSSSSSSSSSSGSSPDVVIERKGSHGERDDYKFEERRGGESKIVKGMLATLT